MSDIRAFRAYRYDLGRVGTLRDVVAPPYDVIDPTLQQALYARSPYNVIRLILNKEEPSDTETQNRYTRAARHLRETAEHAFVSLTRGKHFGIDNGVDERAAAFDTLQHLFLAVLARVVAAIG